MIIDILKNTDDYNEFLQSVKNSQQMHTFLLISKDSFYSLEMATLFAKALLCPETCELCPNCKKVNSRTHPDVKFYPENKKLLVEDSKKIVEESSIKPIFSDKKIFIISSIDNSTEEAQNKLLKSLEEPNDAVYYILTATNLDKILPTIISRCNKIELSQVNKNEIKPFLKGDDCTNELALCLGGGYLNKTIEISKMKNLQEIFELCADILLKLNSSKQALFFVKKILDFKNDFNIIIEMLCFLIEDALLIKAQKKEEIKFKLFEKEISQISSELSIKCLSSFIPVINKAMKESFFNVNPFLIVDNLVMNFLEVKYLCK